MLDDPRLLVVDDEEVVCQSCERILGPQGFRVETINDPRAGLRLAEERRYAAILLDIKMPVMDGISFLEELRKREMDVPVIVITGYPNVDNAARAMRLGASDYISKPFKPQEITRAVQRSLKGEVPDAAGVSEPHATRTKPATAARRKVRFFGQSWFRENQEGTVLVGAVVPTSVTRGVEQVRLSRVGEEIHRGATIASLTVPDGPPVEVRSPISGVVVAVNDVLADHPSRLGTDPCDSGWIACVEPSRLAEEAAECEPRSVLLVNADEASARHQGARLAGLGCDVRVANGEHYLIPELHETDIRVLLLDAGSFGEAGPTLVHRIKLASGQMKIIVVADTGSRWEAAYRKQGIFYYAVEPFADDEIIDILDAAFRPQGAPAQAPPRPGRRPESVSRICITNRNGTKVCLLPAKGLMRTDAGLGQMVREKLLGRLYPLETTLGMPNLTMVRILDAASTYDRVLVLVAKETDRPVGTLTRDTRGDAFAVPPEVSDRVATLLMQPDAQCGGCAGLDQHTLESLAESIVGEMTSC